MIWVDGGVILVLAKISDQNFTAHKIKPTVRWGQEVMPYPDTSHSFPTGHCLSCLGSTKRRLHDKTAVSAMIWVAMVVSFWCLPRFEIKILQEFKRSKIQYGTRIQEVLPYPDTSHSSPMGHCLSCLGSIKRWLHATVYINGDVSTFSLIWNKGIWRIIFQYYLWNLWSLSPIGVNMNNNMKGKNCSYVFVRCLHIYVAVSIYVDGSMMKQLFLPWFGLMVVPFWPRFEVKNSQLTRSNLQHGAKK